MDRRNSFWLKLCIVLVLSYTVLSCSHRSSEVKSLGCTWDVSGLLTHSGETMSFYRSENYGAIIFRSNLDAPDLTSEYTELVESYEYHDLSVKEYVSNKKAPVEGVKLNIVTRSGYQGYISTTNIDYKERFISCVE